MGNLQDLASFCSSNQRYKDIHSVLSDASDLSTFLSSIVEREDSWKVCRLTVSDCRC
jgi:hypothetical protein